MAEYLLTVISGIVVALLGFSFRSWWKDQKARYMLRVSFISELQANIIALSSEEGEELPLQDNLYLIQQRLLTTVFENNTDRLGLLSEQEVEELVDFYASAQMVVSLNDVSAGTAPSDTIGTLRRFGEKVQRNMEEKKETSIYYRYYLAYHPLFDGSDHSGAVMSRGEIEEFGQHKE